MFFHPCVYSRFSNSHGLVFDVCGHLADKSKDYTLFLKKAYELYWDSMLDTCKSQAPQFICLTCACMLFVSSIRNMKMNNHMAFEDLMMWCETSKHTANCYFCFTNITNFYYKYSCICKVNRRSIRF